jgi:hypothetical protein
MSIIDELNIQLTPDERLKVEELVKTTWNNAISRASDVAGRSYYEEEGKGFEPMAPSTIAEHILELKKGT